MRGAVAFAGLLVFVAGRCLVPMDETDLFFNLRLGEIVLGSGHVPMTNLLSFTHPGAPDANLAWLFQIVLALAFRAGGIPATVVLKTAFVVATFAVLFRVAVRRGAHPAAAALLLALSAWAAEPRFVERPHLVTFLGLALVLLALARAEAGSTRMLVALVPAGLVWANANSCFFLAPSVLFLYAVGARFDGRRADARRALWVAAALVPLLFATPAGWRWLPYVANHFSMPSLRPLQEYRAVAWPVDGPFFFLVAAMLLALAWRSSRRALPYRVLLPMIALGLLGARRVRFVAEFALYAGPALAVATTEAGAASAVGRRLGRWLSPAVAGLLALVTVAPRVALARTGGAAFDLGMEKDLVPTAAVDFIETHDLAARLYHDMEVGSYLTWRWRNLSTQRVFQDPRINGYPSDFHAVLRRSDLTRDEWQRFLDGFGVTAALLSYPDVNPRGALFDPAHWALVYRAADGLVWLRRDRGRQALAASREIPLTFAFTAEGGLVPAVIDDAPAAALVPACEWWRRAADEHAARGEDDSALRLYQAALQDGACLQASQGESVRRSLAATALRLGQPARALAALDGVGGIEAQINRGFALLGMHRAGEALAELDAALAAEPRNDEATFGRGLVLEALGRSAEAAASHRALLARSPRHLAAAAARAHLARLPGATH